MKKKYDIGTFLVVVFIVATGLLFCCGGMTSQTSQKDGELSLADAVGGEESGGDAEMSSNDETADVASGDAAQGNVSESEALVTESPELIYVYVCGAVNTPGVYELSGGSRQYEAIEKAGGATEDADLDSLNLADFLADGEKLYVPVHGESVAENPSSDTNDNTSDGLVNINTATADELQTLPGIGEAKAAAIIAYRDEHGAFSSIEDLKQVSGIGDSIFEQLKSLVKVN